MDKTPAAWGPRASKNVRGTVNCNRDDGTTPARASCAERRTEVFQAMLPASEGPGRWVSDGPDPPPRLAGWSRPSFRPTDRSTPVCAPA